MRQRLSRSLQRYRLAISRYQKVVEEQQAGLTPSPDGAFAIRMALIEEAAAREQYVVDLGKFSSLLLHGKTP